jgi:hypothetical protein
MDLTGIWTANDGGIYAVRQIGDLVWWVGLSDPFEFHRGTRFTNVFCGQLEMSPGGGMTINGSWIDLPRGSAAQAGTLLLQVADPSSFTGPVRPKLLQEPFEMEPVPEGGPARRPQREGEPPAAALTAREPNGGREPSGQGPPDGPPSTPQPMRLIRAAETGGFGASIWRLTGDPVHHLDIVTRFNLTWRNDEGTMHDHLKMYKDWVVVTGRIGGGAEGPPTGEPGFLDPAHQSYKGFINACDWADCGILDIGDPPDGDIDFNIQIDRKDLETQPGFWSDGWFNSASAIQAKLNDTTTSGNAVGPDGASTNNMMHCEMCIFCRAADENHPEGDAAVLLPGWMEVGGNRVLYNGKPCSITPLAQTGDRLPVSLGDGPPLGTGDRVRVTGFLALDCHGLFNDCHEGDADVHNTEIHPVYKVERFQDFSARAPDADLSGVWACSDVGTYYLRQAGSDVWWFGISRDDGVSFANVFRGSLAGSTLTGAAVDVPLGPDAPLNTATLSINCGAAGSKATALISDGPAWPRVRWEKIYDGVPANVPPIAIAIDPGELNFHGVPVHDSRTLTTRIWNTGVLELVVSVAAPPAHSPFRWDAVSGATIPQGASIELFVDFDPPGIGHAHGTMLVQSNAPGSPSAVSLDGVGIKGPPQ